MYSINKVRLILDRFLTNLRVNLIIKDLKSMSKHLELK